MKTVMDCARDAMMHLRAEVAAGAPIPPDDVRLPPPARTLLDDLVADIAEGIRVLWKRDGVWVSEDQIIDRARNIAQGLIGNYRIERRL